MKSCHLAKKRAEVARVCKKSSDITNYFFRMEKKFRIFSFFSQFFSQDNFFRNSDKKQFFRNVYKF